MVDKDDYPKFKEILIGTNEKGKISMAVTLSYFDGKYIQTSERCFIELSNKDAKRIMDIAGKLGNRILDRIECKKS